MGWPAVKIPSGRGGCLRYSGGKNGPWFGSSTGFGIAYSSDRNLARDSEKIGGEGGQQRGGADPKLGTRSEAGFGMRSMALMVNNV